MTTDGFRAIVRQELELWMDKNRARFDPLIRKISEAIVPVIAEELRNGIMVRMGSVEPDERQKVGMLLEETAAYIRRYSPQKTVGAFDEMDRLLQELEVTARAFGAGSPPMKSS